MKKPMRCSAALLLAALSLTTVRSEPLSSADREALLENLEKIREDATSRVDARFRLAITAYRDASASEETALEFYLKCVEKVNFEDQDRKAADFRDWKKKEEDKLKDPGFHLALRCQLRWLMLSLRAASEKTRISDIAPEGQELVDGVFREAARLGPQLQTLSQPVTSTVFAKAYEISNVSHERWPQSPVQLDQFYGQVVFPPLRTPARVDALRAAWIKRIQQEITRNEAQEGGGGNGGGINGSNGRRIGPGNGGSGRGTDTDKFTEETLPELQWQMEMDLFKSGDERGAAMNMIEHIQKHLTHRSARQWGEELKSLLAPKETPKGESKEGAAPPATAGQN